MSLDIDSEMESALTSSSRGRGRDRKKCCHCTPECTSIIGLRQRRKHYQKAPEAGIRESTTPPPTYFRNHIQVAPTADSESQASESSNSVELNDESMDVDSEPDSQGSSDESEIQSSASSSSSTEDVYNAVDQGISQTDLSLNWLLDKIQQDHEMRNAAALYDLRK